MESGISKSSGNIYPQSRKHAPRLRRQSVGCRDADFLLSDARTFNFHTGRCRYKTSRELMSVHGQNPFAQNSYRGIKASVHRIILL